MKNIIAFILLSLAATLNADIVIYDEPQVTGYQWVAQKKPAAVFATYGGVIETCSYPKDSMGNSLAYSGVACIEGTNTTNNSNLGGDNRFSILFPKFGWINPAEFTALVYHIRQKTQAAGRMNIHPYGTITGEVQVGAMAKVGDTLPDPYGLNPLNFGPNATWQTITIPMSAFAFPAGTIVDRFTWDIVVLSGWYIDQIILVGTGVIHYRNPYPPATGP